MKTTCEQSSLSLSRRMHDVPCSRIQGVCSLPSRQRCRAVERLWSALRWTVHELHIGTYSCTTGWTRSDTLKLASGWNMLRYSRVASEFTASMHKALAEDPDYGQITSDAIPRRIPWTKLSTASHKHSIHSPSVYQPYRMNPLSRPTFKPCDSMSRGSRLCSFLRPSQHTEDEFTKTTTHCST